MNVLCTIGSQGLSDGRRFFRGDVYEVDDETASTLILNGYAEECVAIEEDVVDDIPEPEKVVDDVVDEVVDDTPAPKTSDKQKKPKKNKR